MQIATLIICLLAGYLVKSFKALPSSPHISINIWVLYVALPATTLRYIPSLKLDSNLILPIISPPLLFFLAWIFLLIVKKIFNWWNKETFGAVLLTIGLGNTSFMGFPLTKAYFGLEGFKISVLFDQVNFIIMSTAGIFVAILYGNKNKNINTKALFIEIISFPSFIAFILSISLFKVINIEFINPILDILSATLIPLALFSIGLQLNLGNFFNEKKIIFFSLGFKLFISPLIILIVGYLLKIKGLEYSVSVFESSMAPMATTSILAAQYGLNFELTNKALSLGIIISLFTTYFWQFIV
ncbi:MAG: AEC family transporter [Solirubrobacteraceae bacterium]